MAAILYIEDAGGRFPRLNLMADFADHQLRYETGSRQTAPPDEVGNIVESMTLVGGATSTDVLRTYIVRLERLLVEASNPYNEVRLYEQTDGEPMRTAVLVGGSVEPVDHHVVHRDLTRNFGLYALVLVRRPWEQPQSEHAWETLDNYGGRVELPRELLNNAYPGRISLFSLAPNGNVKFKTFAVGMKPGLINIDGFNPTIRVETPHAWIQSQDVVGLGGTGEGTAPYGAIDNKCLYTAFTTTTDWAMRYVAPLRTWNTHAAQVSKRDIYVGDYMLWGRFMIQAGAPGQGVDNSTEIGMQVRTSLGTKVRGTKTEPVYVKFAQNQWQMVKLGRIRVGPNVWSRDIDSYAGLANYRIEYIAKLVSGTAGLSRMYMDNLYLVPHEHYAEVTAHDYIDSKGRVDIMTTPNGEIAAFAASRTFIPGSNRTATWPFYSDYSVELTELFTNNWACPGQNDSRLVMVVDGRRGEGTYDGTGTHAAYISVYPGSGVYRI